MSGDLERFIRIADDGSLEEAFIPRGALIMASGALSDPRASTLTPRITTVDWRKGVYQVEGEDRWIPIPANHVRANQVTWRPSQEPTP